MYPFLEAKERVAHILKGMEKVMPEVLKQIEVYRAKKEEEYQNAGVREVNEQQIRDEEVQI